MDHSIELYKHILDSLYDGVYFVDRSRKIWYWNQSAERITGYPEDEVVGKCCSDNILVHVDRKGNNLCKGSCPLSEAIESGRMLERQVFLLHKEGHRVPVHVRAVPLKGPADEIIGAVEVFNDNTLQRETEEKMKRLAKLAFSDEKTGLPNRRYLEMKLSSLLEETRKDAPAFGMLLLYVEHADYTKRGAVSDEALKTVANTLSAALQAGEVPGIWEKQFFAVIVPNARKSLLLLLSDKLRALVLRSNLYDLLPLISIGGTVAKKIDTVETISKRAFDLVEACRLSSSSAVMIDNG